MFFLPFLAMKIQITQETNDLLLNIGGYRTVERGLVPVKVCSVLYFSSQFLASYGSVRKSMARFLAILSVIWIRTSIDVLHYRERARWKPTGYWAGKWAKPHTKTTDDVTMTSRYDFVSSKKTRDNPVLTAPLFMKETSTPRVIFQFPKLSRPLNGKSSRQVQHTRES